MRLKVNVTRADIDAGTDDPCSCPVALGTTRALREAGFDGYRAEWEPYRFLDDPDGLVVFDGDDEPVLQIQVHECPESAYGFASLFDDWYRLMHSCGGDEEEWRQRTGQEPVTEPPGPFSFVVELPLRKPRKSRKRK